MANSFIFYGTISQGTTVSLTILDGNNKPIDGVSVWISTDEAGNNRCSETKFTANGKVEFILDIGDYYIWKELSGVNFNNPETITVA